MMILAFGHEKGVGKDTAARFAMTHLRSNSKVRRVEKKGFADKVKAMTFDLYSWAGLMPGDFYDEPYNHHLKEVVLPKLGKSPRQIWIDFGQGVRKTVRNTTWLDYLFEKSTCDFLLIKDLRFPEEAEAIKDRGGLVYKIVKPDVIHTSDEADDPLLEYTGWNGVITNIHLELNAFYKDVVDIVENMFHDKEMATRMH